MSAHKPIAIVPIYETSSFDEVVKMILDGQFDDAFSAKNRIASEVRYGGLDRSDPRYYVKLFESVSYIVKKLEDSVERTPLANNILLGLKEFLTHEKIKALRSSDFALTLDVWASRLREDALTLDAWALAFRFAKEKVRCVAGAPVVDMSDEDAKSFIANIDYLCQELNCDRRTAINRVWGHQDRFPPLSPSCYPTAALKTKLLSLI